MLKIMLHTSPHAAQGGVACHAWRCPRLPAPLTSWGPASRTCRSSPQRWVAAQASKRQGKPKSSSGSKRSPATKKSRWDFETLMVAWDDAFIALCEDTPRALAMLEQAEAGYEQHGRGFMYVRMKLSSQSKRAAAKGQQAYKGFGGAQAPDAAAAGTPLPNNPTLLELGCEATYVPATVLPALGGIFEQGGAPLPDAAQLAGSAAVQGAGSAAGGGTLAAAAAAGAEGLDPSLLEELQRALRGMDAGRLAGLVGLPLPSPYQPPDAEQQLATDQQQGGDQQQEQEGAAGEGQAEEDGGWVGGERAYEPVAREFVVLLLAYIDGNPTIGADILVAVDDEDEELGIQTRLMLPALEGWGEWSEGLAPA